jgi:hypothetical protein
MIRELAPAGFSEDRTAAVQEKTAGALSEHRPLENGEVE